MKRRYFILLIIFCLSATNIHAQNRSTEKFINSKSCIPGYGIKKKRDASLFQGNRKTKKYFEGWYFKMVSGEGESILSIIPGISIAGNGEEQHAFIQIINGKTAETQYFSYPANEFMFSPKRFAVRIGENFFSADSIVLNIENDSTILKGKIYMTNKIQLTPGNKKKHIMGWYRHVPFMQCYHGVLSLDHDLSGSMKYNGKTFDFSDGKGYIEKDWGRSMPEAWIWMQSNNFEEDNTSFMLSVAHIPWLGSSFTGFLGFFHHDTITTRFGTYSKAKIDISHTHADTVNIIINDKHYCYSITAVHQNAGMLKAPVDGAMDRRIAESIDATLLLVVKDKDGKTIFKSKSKIAGLEVVGDQSVLIN